MGQALRRPAPILTPGPDLFGRKPCEHTFPSGVIQAAAALPTPASPLQVHSRRERHQAPNQLGLFLRIHFGFTPHKKTRKIGEGGKEADLPGKLNKTHRLETN